MPLQILEMLSQHVSSQRVLEVHTCINLGYTGITMCYNSNTVNCTGLTEVSLHLYITYNQCKLRNINPDDTFVGQ